ncbi:MAG TPA: hypothetical protein VEX68_19655 [Bryobacteraceae bacterium]|nr:hypothetical protein [Bryobacteraceae bacterium]
MALILHLIDRGLQQMLAPRVQFVAPTIRFKDVISKQRRYAPVVGYLMTPVALVGYVLAFWRLGADLNWLGEFFIAQGLFSRWQVWLAIAIVTQLVANQLNRAAERDQIPS